MKNRALLLCVLAAPGLAAAADGDEWYVTPFAGGETPDYHRNVDRNDLAYGADLGRELGPLFNIELTGNANGQTFTRAPTAPGHMSLAGMSLDVLAVANRAGTLSPYVPITSSTAAWTQVRTPVRPSRRKSG